MGRVMLNTKAHKDRSRLFLSKSGYTINIQDQFWQLSKSLRLDVGSVRDILDTRYRQGFISTLKYYAENLSATHTKNVLFRFKDFLEKTKSSKVNESSLISYRSTLTTRTEYHLAVLKGFLRKWNELGFEGVTEESAHLLESWRLTGNEKGDLIKRLDPKKGPLSDIELQGFNEKTLAALEQDKLSLKEVSIGLILSHTGRRPIQISHLKIKDVLQGKNKSGQDKYLINIPRAKQRNASFRHDFKQFAITKDLWGMLSAQCQTAISEVENQLPFRITPNERLELPLFPDIKAFATIERQAFQESLNSDQLHITPKDIKSIVTKIARTIDLFSERTGEPIYLTPSRFRYTIGTRAAREGFGELVIAELLDHSDTQNSGVYIQNVPEHAAKLDEAIGHYLAPYAQAFAGLLVDSESEAKRGDDLSSRVKNNNQGIGTCGHHGFCGANVPIPCYTCIHFQPWVHGPHQEVLDELVSERERIKDITGDIQMAAINDRTIIAVSEVIQKCEQRKKELTYG